MRSGRMIRCEIIERKGGGGGGEGKAARLCVGGSTKKKAEIGKDGKASVVVV